MINIAMVSAWHVHAKGYAREISEIPGCKIVAVWDEDEVRGAQWAQELGCKFVSDYDELLKDSSIDAVAVCAPTNMHAEVILKAAKAGKHIFSEKVLTLTTEDAVKIKNEIEKQHLHFTISFPHKRRDSMQFVKQLIDDGKLGTVTYARVRNCHSGSINNWLPPHFYSREQCGGGAMVDLGAHPMYLIAWFLGKPISVQSLFSNVTDRAVEDNAVCLVKFENGAIGVSETGFVSRCDRFTVDISGTDGAVSVANDDVWYSSVSDTDSKWVKAEYNQKNLPSALQYWTDSIKNNTVNTLYAIDDAITLTSMMEAAYKSHESGSVAAVI